MRFSESAEVAFPLDSSPGRAVYAQSLHLATMAVPSALLRARNWIRIVLLGVISLAVVRASDISLVGALVVNLDADAARWTSMVQQLMISSLIRDTQLGYSRLPGVWAPELDLHRFVLEDKLTQGAYNDIVEQDSVVTGETLTLGALGCLESHVLAWRRVVEIGAPMLILEDDVTFSADFDAGLAAVLSQLPADFGLLYLANVVGDVIAPNLRHYNVRSDRAVEVWRQTTPCAPGSAGPLVGHGRWSLGHVCICGVPSSSKASPRDRVPSLRTGWGRGGGGGSYSRLPFCQQYRRPCLALL